MINVADRLKSLRKDNRITHKKVATKCGIEESTIQRLEYSGKPSLDSIVKLAGYFR